MAHVVTPDCGCSEQGPCVFAAWIWKRGDMRSLRAHLKYGVERALRSAEMTQNREQRCHQCWRYKPEADFLPLRPQPTRPNRRTQECIECRLKHRSRTCPAP